MLRESAWRTCSDMWAWDRKDAPGDICGLVGATNALEGLALYGEAPAPPAKPLVEPATAESSSTLALATAGF